MRQMVFLFGLLLFVVFAMMPIGCQYTIANGPGWLTQMAEGHCAIRTTTALLMVLLAGFSFSCFCAASYGDSEKRS